MAARDRGLRSGFDTLLDSACLALHGSGPAARAGTWGIHALFIFKCLFLCSIPCLHHLRSSLRSHPLRAPCSTPIPSP